MLNVVNNPFMLSIVKLRIVAPLNLLLHYLASNISKYLIRGMTVYGMHQSLIKCEEAWLKGKTQLKHNWPPCSNQFNFKTKPGNTNLKDGIRTADLILKRLVSTIVEGTLLKG